MTIKFIYNGQKQIKKIKRIKPEILKLRFSIAQDI